MDRDTVTQHYLWCIDDAKRKIIWLEKTCGMQPIDIEIKLKKRSDDNVERQKAEIATTLESYPSHHEQPKNSQV